MKQFHVFNAIMIVTFVKNNQTLVNWWINRAWCNWPEVFSAHNL